MAPIRSICVYCGSSPGRDEAYVQAGLALGRAIADAGLTLVYGGGSRGIMGAVANGALEAGGKVTGIIPRFLLTKEASEDAVRRLDEVVITEDMHARKHLMFEKSDAFVALPGGIGTVEEIVEVMTWGQLGHHRKPIVFANVNGFWNRFAAMLTHMREDGFIHTGNLVKPMFIDEVAEVVPAILLSADEARVDRGTKAIIDRL
jgi:uncharacterized protein (TIGR00730 family)